jgi:hypothetical protein
MAGLLSISWLIRSCGKIVIVAQVGYGKQVVAQFEFSCCIQEGVISKARVFTSGPRDLRWHSAGKREILLSA